MLPGLNHVFELAGQKVPLKIKKHNLPAPLAGSAETNEHVLVNIGAPRFTLNFIWKMLGPLQKVTVALFAVIANSINLTVQTITILTVI